MSALLDDEAADEAQQKEFAHMRSLYLAERDQDEADLPAHKREGYAERMAEQADLKRKEQREQT